MTRSQAQYQKRQQWQELVQLWEESGLSAAQFCRDMQIQYDHFLYYRGIFQGRQTGFKEIVDEQTKAGITLRVGSIAIAIEKAFDPYTLRQVVQALTHAGAVE